MASGKTSKRARSSRPPAVRQRSISWGTVIAVLAVLVFAGGVLGYSVYEQHKKNEALGALAAFTPSEANHDPSKAIPGVEVVTFSGGIHVRPGDRVAYTHSPPFGGAHEFNWAACTGVVYPNAVRNENMVHSLEHGAVWIAYDPSKIDVSQLGVLRQKVDGKPYMMLSPYPGLDQPISLQSWGHQLKLADPADPRIDQFIQALRVNQFTHPEVGASCDALGPGSFDQDNPPPFDPTPPGPGAKPENSAAGVAPDSPPPAPAR
jgi:hypothetical protein